MILFYLVAFIFLWIRYRKQNHSAVVAVLGDIGRSPRMQYHALSLIKRGYKVHFIGYGDTPLISLLQHPNVLLHILEKPKSLAASSRIVYILRGVFRIIHQSILISWIMLSIPRPEFILAQNPPSVPTLLLFRVLSWVLSCDFIIDWHNFGFSIVALSRKGLIVKMMTFYEKFMGKFATSNLCVTEAMAKELKTWNLYGKIAVLHDKPPSHFKPFSAAQKSEFLSRIDISAQEIAIKNNSNMINNMKVVISSTSWTEDEDFTVLLRALVKYDTFSTSLPKILMIITGKGPLKERFLMEQQSLNLKNVVIRTAFVSQSDYPKLVASCDLGISLHTSSSGLDLPMKIVDMFGCEIPVCAINFGCLNELVNHGQNGLIFNSSDELANQLKELFTNPSKLIEFRKNIKASTIDWDSNWQRVFPLP